MNFKKTQLSKRFFPLFALIIFPFYFQSYAVINKTDVVKADVVIYGGTSAGITCAVQLARDGKNVVIVEPSAHIGGMSVEGLGGSDINNHSDFKNDKAVGGLALEFYKEVAKHYGIQNFDSLRLSRMTWRFEPHVAEKIFNGWMTKYKIPVYKNEKLILSNNSIQKKKNRIVGFETNNKFFISKIFIDATYEGDLLHYSGISTTVGRESGHIYNESKAGIRWKNTYRQFEVKVDPYIIPGDSASGTIHTVINEKLSPNDNGKGDQRVQAYCFRACLTRDSVNRVPFTKPDGYNRNWYEIYSRYAKAGGKLYTPNYSIPNNKTDLGAWHDLSHNLYGMNHEYPNGDYKTRESIYKYHLNFTKGLFWFLANDTAVPAATRQEWAKWGTTKDEFTDNNGWPRMVYIRDGRRMISDYVITEHHTRKDTTIAIADPVGVAFWPPDLHHVRRIAHNGAAYNEGFIFGGNNWKPFSIPYRSLVPRKTECVNLLTPTCLSSSHIAYGAIRLEWTFMVLGQSAAVVAALAIDKKTTVQDVDYNILKRTLLEKGAVLSLQPTNK